METELELKRAKWRQSYRKYHPVQPPRTFWHQKFGRLVTREGTATRIFWNKDMLDYLRRHFPTTFNEELAGCIGVSVRTLIRKARELGLQKDPVWLSSVWEERRKWAHIESRRKGYPGHIQKGQHLSPETEFKPQKIS